ncbi:MAG TPA: 16S rRNA (adenine(1518)-N(6)/adenine(1519)-N(6))-dimethyltransferase RsmA [Thermoclostridium sp.]|nr:16S rRNA (adenine(1518)-N(6)/adenine(1519)-N(6))-dimethyltransferase RsmA [Clostridiaceae bacterium]HOQ75232.1 16S rRNA (adenine(1518)-N(6)/adenine(1519)-N(6))-dimethyltransferase RsmA [Thermoclostridium sp.]HPU44751.1 16S rRNA (adenine(1518)-N(6)/adenine(1519)-N(6))-dimethyltransferase RsmA [Thermoclostridium sp.]
MINTNEILSKYGLKLTKSLGQNFLTDANIIRKIVDTAEVDENDLVLEVGPGIGALTARLAERAGRVVAVEIDRRLLEPLSETLGGYGNVRVIHADIMKTDLRELTTGWNGSLKVVSNLPYYITSPVIMNMLESGIPWSLLVFMVQKEVVGRMVALPGTKDYSALSVAVRYYADPKLAFHVSRNCFIPKPDVDSAVVKLKRRSLSQPDYLAREFLFRVIRASFSQRRKTLLNSLGKQPWLEGGKERLREALARMGLSEDTRAENLSVEQFIQLASELCKKMPS